MDKTEEYIGMIEGRLYSIFPREDTPAGKVVRAAGYSLKAGGKRIRPILVLAFCEMCGGEPKKALDAACAVEYMHTYSLIHDDLPCMDNDDMRRGKPSCHASFGEATALLAGDALAILPFEAISGSRELPPDAALKCIRKLSYNCGMEGMIGGQQIDTENVGKDLPAEIITDMYIKKTAALIQAACLCGVYCAQSPKEDEYAAAAEEYALNLGLAFQIIDDILDVTSTDEVLGKHVGSDAQLDKHTYVRAYGLDSAENAAGEYTEKALRSLDIFDNNGFVRDLTVKLLTRKK